MNSRALGVVLACVEDGTNPADFPFYEGMAKAASKSPEAMGRLIIKAAHDLLIHCGREGSAPANHLALIAKQASWVPQFDDVVNIIVSASKANEDLQKMAFTLNTGDVTGAVGSVAKGVGYGTLLGGSALGSLYWLLSRHANQDESDIEAMKNQVNTYNQLTSEIEEGMRRKYHYEQQNKKKPVLR